ncbi:hypothetical protein CB1_000849055, partial [Camelus ferus]
MRPSVASLTVVCPSTDQPMLWTQTGDPVVRDTFGNVCRTSSTLGVQCDNDGGSTSHDMVRGIDRKTLYSTWGKIKQNSSPDTDFEKVSSVQFYAPPESFAQPGRHGCDSRGRRSSFVFRWDCIRHIYFPWAAIDHRISSRDDKSAFEQEVVNQPGTLDKRPWLRAHGSALLVVKTGRKLPASAPHTSPAGAVRGSLLLLSVPSNVLILTVLLRRG